MNRSGQPSPLTTLRRHPERGRHDAESIFAILDEALIAHVGFVRDERAVVIPMAFARVGNSIVVHGARANATLERAAAGERVCLTITIVDGLVLARSAFRHSMNYRSVVVFGRGRDVTEANAKRAALDAIVDRLGANRSVRSRPPSKAELAATRVVSIPLDEASAKIRSGPPADADTDRDRDIWAGEIRLRTLRDPVRAPDLGAPVLGGADEGVVERVEDGVVYSTDPSRLDVGAIHAFLSNDSYWAAGVTRETVDRSIEGSLVASASEAGHFVGFARAVTDRATFAWIADVFVVEGHRHRGIATRLVEFLRGHPDLAGVRRTMLGTKDAHGFYERLGFRVVPDGRFLQAG